MANEKLTKKQDAFLYGVMKGMSQRDAYRAAYNASRMSDAAVDVEASRLLKIPKVALRYDELRSKALAVAEEQAIMSAVEILKEIESIAKDDISNYLDFRTEKTLIGHDEDGEPVYGYKTIVEMKDSRTIDTKNVSEVSVGVNGTFKFKLYSREAALAKLAELQGVDVLRKAKQRLAEDRFEHDKDIDSKRYW